MALKSIPSVVQLPGGIQLSAVPFQAIEWDAEGHPIAFKLLPPGERGDWMFFANEHQLRTAKLKEPPAPSVQAP